MRTYPTAIDGTETKRWFFPANDEHIITAWEPGVGYLAHIDGDEEKGTGVGSTRLAAISDLSETLGRDD